ncbi:MAG TPA: response regulator transcription factor [Desulfuromonadaceae bacterium]|nr:response regulator transcription factor [Desulfuromonadaceae bacterium]
MPISVCIVEDNAGTRDSLAAMLKNAPNLQCLATYGSAEDALADLPNQKPDVALVDINLPGMSGIDCVAQLKARMPKLLVLMLTRFDESDLIFNALRAGASGYLLKKSVPDEICEAIAQVHSGGAPMSMQIARKVVDHFYQIQQPKSDVDTLSQREHEVLTLLAKGFLYKEIADQLNISLGSVRTYLMRIYEKLHVQSRTEATVKFLAKERNR